MAASPGPLGTVSTAGRPDWPARAERLERLEPRGRCSRVRFQFLRGRVCPTAAPEAALEGAPGTPELWDSPRPLEHSALQTALCQRGAIPTPFPGRLTPGLDSGASRRRLPGHSRLDTGDRRHCGLQRGRIQAGQYRCIQPRKLLRRLWRRRGGGTQWGKWRGSAHRQQQRGLRRQGRYRCNAGDSSRQGPLWRWWRWGPRRRRWRRRRKRL